MRYNFAADSFYIMKLCSRLFVLYCRSRSKDDRSRHFDHHLEEVRGGVDGSLESPCRVLVKRNWTSFSVSYGWGATRQNVSKLAAFRSLGAKIIGGRGRPWGIFFGFYKTRHILLFNSANCTVLRAVVLTQDRRVTDRPTDRQTDRRNCCSY